MLSTSSRVCDWPILCFLIENKTAVLRPVGNTHAAHHRGTSLRGLPFTITERESLLHSTDRRAFQPRCFPSPKSIKCMFGTLVVGAPNRIPPPGRLIGITCLEVDHPSATTPPSSLLGIRYPVLVTECSEGWSSDRLAQILAVRDAVFDTVRNIFGIELIENGGQVDENLAHRGRTCQSLVPALPE